MVIIRRIKKILKELFFKDTITSFGNDYSDKVFYVIRRNESNSGIGSFIITNLGYIAYAIRKGYIPIVDMKTYKNIYNINLDTNSWELFFKQPYGYSLDDIKKAKNVIISPETPCIIRPRDNMFYFNIFFGYLSYWKKIAVKYLIINENINKEINTYCNNILMNNNKVLGVFLRGTDYIKLKPLGHPIQPTAEEMIKKIDSINKRYHFNNIFLVTEDRKIFEKFQDKYGDKLLSVNNQYINYTNNGYLANSYKENDSIEFSKKYLISLYVLSKCKYIIVSRTSGTVSLMLLNNRYKYKYIYNLGVYE